MNLAAPWMLLLLPLVGLVGWLMARARRLQREAAAQLKGVSPGVISMRPGRRDWLILAALASIVIALARPQWNPQPFEIERRGRDLVIVLDVSRSMLAADVFPNRLEAARIAIHEAIPALAGQRIALITFAGSAAVRVPLTLDHGFVRYLLDRADPSDMDLGSTSLQAAVEKAVSSVLTDATGERRDLVIFTDGEDHLSDMEKTAELLAKCRARVLIIGLGDAVEGARVPALSGTDPWMRHNDAEVVSRLDESSLLKLADKNAQVTYYRAGTRPFDLERLYRKMLAGATDAAVVGQMREVRYTEGYPYLLGLAAALWLASSVWKWPAARSLVVLAMLLPGCGRNLDDGAEALFQARCAEAAEKCQRAEERLAEDPPTARSLLVEGREAYLRAALLRPGNRETARRITALTGRLREVDATIERQRADESKRRAKLAEIIRTLEALTVRQAALSLQSRELLRRRPEPTAEEMNRLASPALTEQQAVHQSTTQLLDAVRSQQDRLRELLAKAYGSKVTQLPTEVDASVDLLATAVEAQGQAIAGLQGESIRWPKVNIALHAAAGRMQQAIESLRGLQPPSEDQKPTAPPRMSDNSYDEDISGPESDTRGAKPQPISPGDFQDALLRRTLPVPRYTSADILAEESANQQRRAKQKAVRAAAKVEKNW